MFKCLGDILKQLFFGTKDLNDFEPKCKCGSKNVKEIDQSMDGFYIEVECEDCGEKTIL